MIGVVSTEGLKWSPRHLSRAHELRNVSSRPPAQVSFEKSGISEAISITEFIDYLSYGWAVFYH